MRQNYKKDENNATVGKRETIRRILLYCAKYKKDVALVSILAFLGALCKTVIPVFTEKAIDVDISNKDVRGLIGTISIAVVLAIAWGILSIIRDHLTVKIANDVVYRARSETYENILSLPLGFFDSRPSGRIITRVIND